MSELTLYNSLARKEESLKDLVPGKKIGLYVCGPTVYDISHIGHGRSAFTFEIMRRYLEFRGYEVVFVRNVTDVDDKIIDRARKEGGDLKETVRNISERYLSLYHEEMERLGVAPPTEEPRATEYISAMQGMISEILNRGAAYVAGGDVYFDIQKAASYGKLSKRNPEEMLEGTRAEPSQNKRHPLDFALWKSAKPEEPSWESPWGLGRPGWHIECSTMSTEIFKKRNVPFVIHGGGLDLIFPHHENEIAQAEGSNREFAKLWAHNGLLTVQGQKMAKSLGNFITLQELFQKAEPEVIRFYFLQTHYRRPLDFSWEKLEETAHAYEGFGIFFEKWGSSPESASLAAGKERYAKEFLEAMDDDLNTPEALSVVFTLLSECQKLREPSLASLLTEMLTVLGVMPVSKEKTIDPKIEEKISERNKAREQGDFKKADQIRKELLEKGIILEDEKGKTLWRRVK